LSSSVSELRRMQAASRSRITQPTLAILGENTSPTFPERLRLLVSWLPKVEPFELPATHLLHLQNPRGMAEALISFYAQHPLTASTA
jgi:pimeloyl-ACP methyl ester carboxylesterase